MTDHKDNNTSIHMTTAALEEMVGHPLRRHDDSKTLDLHSNIGRLEQSITSTNEQLRDFAARTNANIDRLTKYFEDVNKSILQSKQTNWGMIASWVGVLVLLLGLVVYQPLQEIRTNIVSHTEDGHPASVITKIEHNVDKFSGIAERLQHEIELLEATDQRREEKTSKRINDLEKWSQEVLAKYPADHAIFKTKLEMIVNEIEKLRTNSAASAKSDVSFKERILDIEREIYTGAHYRAGRPIKTPDSEKK